MKLDAQARLSEPVSDRLKTWNAPEYEDRGTSGETNQAGASLPTSTSLADLSIAGTVRGFIGSGMHESALTGALAIVEMLRKVNWTIRLRRFLKPKRSAPRLMAFTLN
jgi:hypothetical protein